MIHPHAAAIKMLTDSAAIRYSNYEAETSLGNHDSAKLWYDKYVELQTAAQFLSQNLPSGVLNPNEVESSPFPRIEFQVPENIHQAAQDIDAFFRSNSLNRWAFGGIQSRAG